MIDPQEDAPAQPRRTAVGWLPTLLVFLAALAVLTPTTADYGLTYDEPAYTLSQNVSAQWWERLSQARSASDLSALLEPDALLYYWPYGRHGFNFHPPLAGQVNLLFHTLLSPYISAPVARRLASVVEFALVVTLIFHFMTRRYGTVAGLTAAYGLLLMPRVHGQAHLIDTDIPGLLLWVATALAFWNGLREPDQKASRVLVGILVGLCFIEKMAAMAVVLPLLAWLAFDWLARVARGRASAFGVLDAAITLGLMAVPLGLVYVEIQHLAALLPEPRGTNLFVHRPRTWMPGCILAVPFLVWLARRGLAMYRPSNRLWGPERPSLEIIAAIMAFGPLIAWVGNPAWWRETLPRLAHYYALNTNRRGALPDIQILYLGRIYEFALPWHNGWVLMAITVPVGLLAFAILGIVSGLIRIRRDLLPTYLITHLCTLPALRMLATPAHDGVRLMLPSLAFLCMLAALGIRDTVFAVFRRNPARARRFELGIALAVIVAESIALVFVHPYELSYYNALVGHARGAWHRGFELSYWYDAFTPRVIDDLNARLPKGAHVSFPNDLSAPSTFQELQSLGLLRDDIRLDSTTDDYPYLWLLTHDSKAMATTRLLFAMQPWYASWPRQLGGARVLTVADPQAAARATALQLLTDAGDRTPPDGPQAPKWVQQNAPFLARFWGDGLIRARRLTLNTPMFDWARDNPGSLRAAANRLVERVDEVWPQRGVKAKRAPLANDPDALRLLESLTRYDGKVLYSTELMRKQPQALIDAALILTTRPEAVASVLTRYGFTDPALIGGYLDRDLPGPPR